MNRIIGIPCAAAVSLVLAGCGSGAASQPAVTVTATATETATRFIEVEPTAVPTPAALAEEEPAVVEPAAETFKMPSLVGQNLQLAQDKLQALGSYSLRQEDASGLERFAVLDSNWQVCRQAPKPGKRVSVDKTVTLWSVKLDESC